jgi:hypothetical protein
MFNNTPCNNLRYNTFRSFSYYDSSVIYEYYYDLHDERIIYFTNLLRLAYSTF